VVGLIIADLVNQTQKNGDEDGVRNDLFGSFEKRQYHQYF